MLLDDSIIFHPNDNKEDYLLFGLYLSIEAADWSHHA